VNPIRQAPAGENSRSRRRSYVGAGGAERRDPLHLGVPIVRVQGDMQAILHRLALGHGQEAQAGIGVLIRADDDFVISLEQDGLFQDRGPEPGQRGGRGS